MNVDHPRVVPGFYIGQGDDKAFVQIGFFETFITI